MGGIRCDRHGDRVARARKAERREKEGMGERRREGSASEAEGERDGKRGNRAIAKLAIYFLTSANSAQDQGKLMGC